VAVEVDLPLVLEIVLPLEISTVLRLWLLDLGFSTLWLVLHVSFACKVFQDHPQKIFGFHGEIANHLRLGLAKKKKNLKRKIRVSQKLD
jgi:hypothetical protein